MRGFLIAIVAALAISQSYAADKCPSEDGPDDVFLPNPSDCNSFYKCLGGEAHLNFCPPGLHWAQKLSRCEWPEVAKCKETEPKPPKPTTSKPPKPTKPPGPKPTSCPAEDGPDDVLLPNPEDCGSFFKCLNGVPHLIPCPPNQEWSTEFDRCDWPEIAKCKTSEARPEPVPDPEEKPEPEEKPQPETKPSGCPAENGLVDVLLPNPSDCGSFYKCLNGEPHLVQCPVNQEWSVELNRCDWPEIAKCKTSEAKPEPVPDPEEKPEPEEKPQPETKPNGCPAENGPVDVLLPNPADCGSFYKCLNGEPHLIPCPVNQEWSVELSRCDYPEIAKCKTSESTPIEPAPKPNEPKPEPSNPETSKPKGCPAVDSDEDVLLPNPADCSSFYKCEAGVPVLIKCPPHLEWSSKLNRCEWPDIAQCKESESRPDPEPVPEESQEDNQGFDPTPTECPAENGGYDIFLPNYADCSTYYRCDHGAKFLMHCPVGTLWYDRMKRCDHISNAVCATRPY